MKRHSFALAGALVGLALSLSLVFIALSFAPSPEEAAYECIESGGEYIEVHNVSGGYTGLYICVEE